MPPVFRNDPYPAYNFEVIVTGISDDGGSVKGSFSEVSGLGAELYRVPRLRGPCAQADRFQRRVSRRNDRKLSIVVRS
jgi:hypothetical protein